MNFPPILSQKTCFSRKNALFLKKITKKFGGNKKMPTFAIPNETNTVSNHAEVAQLVEHNLAKVGVASSSLVFCSKKQVSSNADFRFEISPDGVQSYVSRPCAQGTAFLFLITCCGFTQKKRGQNSPTPVIITAFSRSPSTIKATTYGLFRSVTERLNDMEDS